MEIEEIIEEKYETKEKLVKKQKELKLQNYNIKMTLLEIEQSELKLLLKKNELIKELNANGGRKAEQTTTEEESFEKSARFDPYFAV